MDARASPPPVLPGAVDVLVIGAGSSGAAAAAKLAEAGFSVLLVDRRPLRRAGAWWVNGVAFAQFDAAGLPRPADDELAGGVEPMHLLARRTRLLVDDHGVPSVRMDRLVARLQGAARRAGARLLSHTPVVGLACRPGAPVRVRLSDGASVHALEAGLVVDASGLPGVARRFLPELRLLCPPVAPEAICAAAQASFPVCDPEGAEAFRKRMAIGPGEVLARVGVEGGYSVENLRVGVDRAEILTGAIPALGFSPGRRLLDRLAAALPFLGAPAGVGQRPIPLRRPYDALAHGRIVLLGDAGAQVFAGHGSGVGIGLVAARLLAESVAEEGAANETAAWRYAHRFQTTLGPLLAASAHFSRFTARLPPGAVAALFEAGLLTQSVARNGLSQQTGLPPPVEWPDLALGTLRQPALSRALVRELGAMARLARHYRRFPDRRDGEALRQWSHAAGRLAGEVPDVP
jgi:menaquinone-9 beta-reductase